MALSAQEMVDLYITAEQEVLAGKSTTVNGRVMTMENLQDIRDGRKEWERRASNEAAVAAGTPRKRHSLVNFYE